MSLITAKTSQANARAKAQRLIGMSNTEKPFYSDGVNACEKTGMRPVSTTAYKKGGKVVGKSDGLSNAARADRVKRKAGGRIQDKFANIDQKEANKERIGGKAHCGGLKKGGRIKKEGGGSLLKRMIGGPKTGSDMSEVGKDKTQHYSASDKAAMERLIREGDAGETYKKGGSVKKPKAVLSKAAPASSPAKAMAKAPLPKAPKISEAPMSPKAAAQVSAMKPKASQKPEDVSTEMTAIGTETPEEEEAEGAEMLKKGGRAKRASGGRDGAGVNGSSGRGETKGTSGGGSSSVLNHGEAGFRAARKSGGRAAKGSKINIIISAPQGGDPNAQMMQQPSAPSPRTPPPGAPPMMAGQPMGGPMMPPPGAGPQLPPGMAGGPMPPMGMKPPGRKAGGRIGSYASLKAGAGSGLGRLKKQGMK
jgi:hypothetical protein